MAENKKKWTSTSFGVNGGIPHASASGYGFSVKATAAISVSASLCNVSVTGGQISFAVLNFSCTGIIFTQAGLLSLTAGAKHSFEGAVNNMTGLSSVLRALETSMTGSRTGVTGVIRKSGGLKLKNFASAMDS